MWRGVIGWRGRKGVWCDMKTDAVMIYFINIIKKLPSLRGGAWQLYVDNCGYYLKTTPSDFVRHPSSGGEFYKQNQVINSPP